MDVKCANKHIEEMREICEAGLEFYKAHEELEEELSFLFNAVAFLGDYIKVLEKAIDRAKLDI